MPLIPSTRERPILINLLEVAVIPSPTGNTPMLQQYYQAKEEAGDAILFFRLGDFYEMFDDDALEASKILDITLTSRDAGREARIPMCGVPFHSAEGYIARLLDAGKRVAICEQVQDPREAKGLVKREIVRVISPGTVIDPTMLDDKRNNYLAAVCCHGGSFGLAVVDVSAGQFFTTEIRSDEGDDRLLSELVRLRPSEILLPYGDSSSLDIVSRLRSFITPAVTKFPEEAFSPQAARRTLLDHFGVVTLEGYGCEQYPLAIAAAGAVIRYVKETQRMADVPILQLQTFNTDGYMIIDASSRRNLELTQTMREGGRSGSLIWVLDRTRTAMGGRLLRQWLEQPLLDTAAISGRQDCVDELYRDATLRYDILSILSKVPDLERLTGRVVFGSANGRDLRGIWAALTALEEIRKCLRVSQSTFDSSLLRLFESISDLSDLSNEIDHILVEAPPFSIREGGMVRQGYASELDKLRNAKSEGKEWVSNFEAEQREKTGIKSLKVAFNQVFGYYVEVTRSNLGLVPADYIRKQTLANAERYITPELKEYEELILGADERITDMEFAIFQELRQKISGSSGRLLSAAGLLAHLDVFAGLSEVAAEKGYTRPKVDRSSRIHIREGRHPVVEEGLKDELFVANDCTLDDSDSFAIITGPNMAGKSTYIRQVALITLLAQMGSFVPAASAEIGVVDRIFTRVGASDDLATGRSTFMVELSELANILNHATSNSLIILDEIGRGTSTFDGLSIAWAVTEYIHDPNRIGAKTLFATHYHELTELEKVLPGVSNYSVAIKQIGEEIVFLRKIVKGGMGKSFGIEVAKLAGLPLEVIERAREILANLEQADDIQRKQKKRRNRLENQMLLFSAGDNDQDRTKHQEIPKEYHTIAGKLADIDINSLSPLQALLIINELQPLAKSLCGRKDGEAVG